MKYGILEKKNSSCSIVGTTNSKQEMIIELQNKYQNAKLIHLESLDLMTKDYDSECGTYLVVLPTSVKLVEKRSELSGYIFSSTQYFVCELISWECIKLEPNAQSDLLVNEVRTVGLNIPLFKLYQIKDGDIIALIGPTDTGKSTMISHILHNYSPEKLKHTMVISPTEQRNPFYKSFFPGIRVEHQLVNEKIYEFIDECSKQNISGTVVFDDCFAYKNKLQSIKHVIQSALKKNITIIATALHPLSIDPSLDPMLKTVFLFEEKFVCTQKKLFNRYAGFFKSFDIFKKFFESATRDHSCIVIHNQNPNDYPFTKMAWCRAELYEK